MYLDYGLKQQESAHAMRWHQDLGEESFFTFKDF